ncbi:Zn-ribbon domain-containing OB-fold protein [Petrotoga sp. 9PWA.NaAc.5.4]|uniref:Zn-ribbon domain-containing OB-fold protein n=1 Tax=Petrotoga sp. 9PWA.NaAc.5.4 TaxID=1434328 RepID=UPI000CC298C1|nr:Zn-ribbon domain-containing OB-fold protein [Petrotoga sp. 9PWA.NaAc.5.4]PNR92276.1 hypothetical protein X924_10235 [Petrotoga sp. 9PWA.NaAc.5.4]
MIIIQDYINALKKGKIFGSKCNKCGSVTIPPHPVCPDCGNFEMDLFEIKSEGEVKSFTIIYIPPEQFKEESPYIVAIVSLNDGGGSILGRLLEVDPNNPENIKIGMKVKFEPLLKNDKIVVAFRPV